LSKKKKKEKIKKIEPENPRGKTSFNSNCIERLQKSPVKLEIIDLIHPCWTTIDVNRFTAGMTLTKCSS